MSHDPAMQLVRGASLALNSLNFTPASLLVSSICYLRGSEKLEMAATDSVSTS